MNENRRPPSLHRPVKTNPTIRSITFVLTDKRVCSITPSAETADRVLEEMSKAINNGNTIALHDPHGSVTVLNPAHVISMELR